MMDDVITEIYPPELSLTSDEATVQANYLDLSIEIKNGKIHTSLFDKRDTFGFAIVNFPDLSGKISQKQSYGVFVSQLIRYMLDAVKTLKTFARELENWLTV